MMKVVTLIVLALSFIAQIFLINVAIDGYYLYTLILSLVYIGLTITCFTLIAVHWKEK